MTTVSFLSRRPVGATSGARHKLAALGRNETFREWAGKLGMAGLCGFLCLGALARFATILAATTGLDALDIARLAAATCQTVFYVLVAWFTLIRRPAVKRARGIQPRATALLGTLSVFAFAFLPPASGLPLAWHIVATALLLASAALASAVVTRLGRSLTVMAEARRLVTSGPYRFVRHPLYVVEELAALAGFIEAFSLWAGLLLAVQVALQLGRICNEEAVLEAAFPEYRHYKAATAGLIPGVW